MTSQTIYMYIQKLVFAVSALFLTLTSVHAQDGFHRTYSMEIGDHVDVFDAVASGGGAYYSVAGLYDGAASATAYPELLVTGFNNKGSISWAQRLYSPDSTAFKGVASIAYGDDSRLYIIATIDQPQDNILLYCMTNAGQLDSTYAVSNGLVLSSTNRVIATPDSGIAVSYAREAMAIAAVTKIGLDLEVDWSRGMSSIDANMNTPTLLRSLADSTIIAAGEATATNRAWVSILDTLGSQVAAALYTVGGDAARRVQPMDYAIGSDTTRVMVGNYQSDPSSSDNYSGWVLSTTQTGEVIWAHRIDFGDDSRSSLYHVDVDSLSGVVRVFGERQSATDPVDAGVFVVDIDPTGTQLVHYVIDTAAARALPYPSSGLVALEEGYAYIGNMQQPAMPGGAGLLQTNFLLLDAMISTGCSSTSDQQVLTPITAARSNININYSTIGSIRGVDATTRLYQGYTVPTLNLRDTLYCPDVPIMYLMDATLADALSYTWSTGSQDSAIIATEEGEFIVDVEMGGDICYTLCDTATISIAMPPVVMIIQQSNDHCTTGTDRLVAVVQSQVGISSIQWSDGTQGRELLVSELGTYSVVVTDVCGQTSEQSITITDFLQPMPTVSIVQGDCANELVAVVAPEGTQVDYTWSTDDTTPTTTIDSAGDYSVTVVDGCDQSAEATITITEIESDGPVVDIQRICDELAVSVVPADAEVTYLWSEGSTSAGITATEAGTYTVTVTDTCGFFSVDAVIVPEIALELLANLASLCDSNFVEITAAYSDIAADVTYQWSNGETQAVIRVNDPGTYAVTVTDPRCGNVVSDSIVVETTVSLRWPKLFFPNGMASADSETDTIDNRTFRPLNPCRTPITDFELHVFNRWGNEVFTGDNPIRGWNGNHGDARAPEGVYIWWSLYTLQGVEYADKGNITLLR